MKKKFSRILGVAVTLALVASLFGFAIPVAAAPQAWSAIVLPTGAGNVIGAFDVRDMAVASDGTIYVSDNQTGRFFKSADGGNTFSNLTAGLTTAVYTAPPMLVAVAADDPNAVAIVDSTAAVAGTNAAGQVYISNNGGITWSALPVSPDGTAPGTSRVLDIAVSPAIAGAALGRHYAIAVADDGAGTVVDGAVWIIGQGTIWADPGATLSTRDFSSVAFSPNYVGDRTLVAVGSNATDTFLHMYNTLTAAAVGPYPVTIETATSISPQDFDAAWGLNKIVTSDIALPSDFDPTIVPGRRTYVAWNAVGAVVQSDVYRVDHAATYKLGIAATVDIHSISYSGTRNTGYLVAGQSAPTAVNTVQVWYSENPQTAMPTWGGSLKTPTGRCNAVVGVAPDFATTNTVYAGTASPADCESAFSVSTDKGNSFNQLSLIDTVSPIPLIQDVMPTPDGTTVFMATVNNNPVCDVESLWKSPVPTTLVSWERIDISPAGVDWGDGLGDSIVRLNPNYSENPSLWWIDRTPGTTIRASADGGAVFATRTAPAAIIDFVAESKDVVYMGDAANVRKSTNAAWWFAPPAVAPVTAVRMLAMAPSYPNLPEAGHLLVGGTGAEVGYSTDGAASFVPALAGLPAATQMQVVADTDYATNNTIYCGSNTLNQGIYRWVIGTSISWENLWTPAAGERIYGMVATNGLLYGGWDDGTDSAARRTLTPTAPAGFQEWADMDIGAAAGRFIVPQTALRIDATASPVLWAIDTTGAGAVMAYTDALATALPVLTGPADGVAVSIDPVSGRADLQTLTWESMGVSTGLTTDYDIDITKVEDVNWAARFRDPSRAVGNPAAPQLTVGAAGSGATWAQTLEASTSYMWRVRAEDQVGLDNIISPWSESRVINIQAGGVVVAPQVGPILLGPVGGATNVSVTPGFSWAPIAGATEYEFILALDSTLTQTVEGTPVYVSESAWQVPATTLDYDTTYFWAVKATEPTESPQAFGTFQTMKAPTVFTCPICGETFDTETELSSHMDLEHPAELVTPGYIWGIIGIGAILVIVVLVLIVRTRRTV